MISIEQREIIIVTNLFPRQDISLSKHSHSLQTIYMPFLHLTVGITRVVHKPNNDNANTIID